MAKRAPRAAVAVVVAVLLLALAACSAGASGSGGAPKDKSVAIGLVLEPKNLDFTRTDGAAIPQVLLVNVYEGLVKLDPASGNIVPSLAKSWTISPDRKTYDFTLHSGVKFANGDDFDANSVKFSIERVKSDAWTISLKKAMNVVDHVDVVSPTRVRVVLSKPSNDWLFRMTTRIGAMFSPGGVGDLASQPIGTGPYELKKWTRGYSIVFKARDDYWGQRPAMDTVTFRYFNDPSALNNALLSGGIDIVGTVQTPDALDQFNNKRYKIIEGTTNSEVVLAFNNAKGPLTDIRVRRAIKYAINHKGLLDTAWGGYGTLIGSMVPPSDPWYEDLTGLYPYDPARAKQLLAEAGKPRLTLRLRLPNVPYAIASGQVVKSQLAEVGITANIDVLEFPARWLDVVFTNHDYDMSIISHVEPRDMGIFASPSYYFGFDNARYRQLLAQADGGPPAEQTADLKKAARLLAEEAAADWLFLLPYLVVTASDISGVPPNGISESFDVTQIRRSGT